MKTAKERQDNEHLGWSWIKNTPSWCIPLTFIAIGIVWFFRIPGTGKASALLGVGAALMPIFWEKSKKWARAIWIAMLFLLLGVEYRAIAQDRQEFANQFLNLLNEERNVLEEERGGDSYPWLIGVNPHGSGYPPQFDGTGKWALFVENSGKAPLRDVILRIQDCPREGETEASNLEKMRRQSVIQLGTLWSSEYGEYSLNFSVQPGCYAIMSSTRVTTYMEYLMLPSIDSNDSHFGVWDSHNKLVLSTFPANVHIGNLPMK